jgi:hypothetical protein
MLHTDSLRQKIYGYSKRKFNNLVIKIAHEVNLKTGLQSVINIKINFYSLSTKLVFPVIKCEQQIITEHSL